jgi:DNA adenine methylase
VTAPLVAPFPYFGGKRRVAAEVWSRFGNVRSYVEPFFGSGAVLLARPTPFSGVETVNDKDGLLCNFWRAVQADPAAVARHADWPVSECDLHARHLWLVERREDITGRLMADPAWFDAQAAERPYSLG